MAERIPSRSTLRAAEHVLAAIEILRTKAHEVEYVPGYLQLHESDVDALSRRLVLALEVIEGGAEVRQRPQRYDCPVCGDRFDGAVSYHHHLVDAHPDIFPKARRDWQCDRCGRVSVTWFSRPEPEPFILALCECGNRQRVDPEGAVVAVSRAGRVRAQLEVARV